MDEDLTESGIGIPTDQRLPPPQGPSGLLKPKQRPDSTSARQGRPRVMRKGMLALFLTACLSAAFLAGLPSQQRAAAVEPDPVIAAAGDIACPPPGTPTARTCHQAATADLLTSGGYTAVLPLGDEQYNCGELSAFNAVYDPTWGKA